jgi:hypothetical protein
MAEIDPIRTLGLASQFKTPAADNAALRDLQTKGAITGMQQSGANLRNAANIAGSLRQAALLDNRVLTPEEIQPGARFSTATTADASLRQGLANALVGAKGADFARSAGITPKQVVGPDGKLTDPTFKLGDVAGLDFISGGYTKGEAQAMAKALIEQKELTAEERKIIEVNGVEVGMAIVTKKRQSESKARQENTGRAREQSAEVLDDARAERMRTFMQSKHPNSLVENPRVENGLLYIDIDGIKTQVRSLRNK